MAAPAPAVPPGGSPPSPRSRRPRAAPPARGRPSHCPGGGACRDCGNPPTEWHVWQVMNIWARVLGSGQGELGPRRFGPYSPRGGGCAGGDRGFHGRKRHGRVWGLHRCVTGGLCRGSSRIPPHGADTGGRAAPFGCPPQALGALESGGSQRSVASASERFPFTSHQGGACPQAPLLAEVEGCFPCVHLGERNLAVDRVSTSQPNN